VSNFSLLELTEPESSLVMASNEERFAEVFRRIQALEGKPSSLIDIPKSLEPWPKRNAYWVFPTLTLALGSGFVFSFFHWWFADLVDHQIDAKLATPAKDIQQIKVDLASLGTKLDTFISVFNPLIVQRLRAAASLPADQLRKELPEVKATVAIAIDQKITGGEEAIRRIGKQAIDLAATSPDVMDVAWQAATATLNYRSFLTVKPPGAFAIEPLPPDRTWRYQTFDVPGKPFGRLNFTNILGVPSKDAAHMNKIGEDFNKNLQRGPLFLTIWTPRMSYLRTRKYTIREPRPYLKMCSS
jgi:hypothetical protein